VIHLLADLEQMALRDVSNREVAADLRESTQLSRRGAQRRQSDLPDKYRTVLSRMGDLLLMPFVQGCQTKNLLWPPSLDIFARKQA
jgi:hypothetical protein